MQVNPQQLLDDGFIILRQVVPPEQLDSLRASYETIVERQHRIWAGELDWDERVAMDYKSKQPRIVLSAVVDAATADTVEFNLHDAHAGRQPPTDAGAGGRACRHVLHVQPGDRPRPRPLAPGCGS